MAHIPNTPEGVALALFRLLLGGSKQLSVHQALDLYTDCLNAAWGEREISQEAEPTRH